MKRKSLVCCLFAIFTLVGSMLLPGCGETEEPKISGVSPDSGSQGETLAVTVTGDRLGGATAVGFGLGITVHSITVNSSTQITADITIDVVATAGTRDVSVITPEGTDTLYDGFTVMESLAGPYEGPLFDVQAHAIVPGMSLEAAKAALLSDVSVTEETKEVLRGIYDAMADDLEGQDRLDDLGEDGIQVITLPLGFPPFPAQTLLDLIVIDTNEWLANRTAANPQLIGMATVAPPPVMAAEGMTETGLAVCRSAIEDLGLKGIFLSAQYGGVFLGDPVYEPYFALADELGVPIIIHPAVDATEWDLVARKNIPVRTGFVNDQRTTILDIVQAGILENYPDLTIIATHLGGGILSIIGRIEQLSDAFPDEQYYTDLQGQEKPLPHPISYYLKKIYYDCNNAEVEDIVAAAEKVGIDHLLTGTDFPWIPTDVVRDVIGNLPFSAEEKEAIAYGNAAGLFGMGS